MADEAKAEKNLAEASECLSEAARLIVLIAKHYNEDVVAAALQWRFGIGSWESTKITRDAKKLLDAMPKSR